MPWRGGALGLGAGPGGAHVVQQRWETQPQLCAQASHRRPRLQQYPPQSAQRCAHESRIAFTQHTQERGQQHSHVSNLRSLGLWAAALRPRPVPPGPVPHLPTVQREVAEAKQPQPTHCGLRVALPSAEPLQDDLLRKEPRGGPALQQLGRAGDRESARSRSRCRRRRLGAESCVTRHQPSRKQAHPSEEGHSRKALSVVGAAQPGQQVSEQAPQVMVRMGHHGAGVG